MHIISHETTYWIGPTRPLSPSCDVLFDVVGWWEMVMVVGGAVLFLFLVVV